MAEPACSPTERALRCDCGYVARGLDTDEFVIAAQGHASDVHRVELTRELILRLEDEALTGTTVPGSSATLET